MNSLQRFNLRVIFLSSVFLLFVVCCKVSAEDKLLNLADKFFTEGNFKEAIVEYKRFIFFHPEDLEDISYALYKIGLAYANSSNWLAAKDTLRRAIELTENSLFKDKIRVDLGIVLIASKDYSLAQLELLNLIYFSQFESIRRKALYYLGITYLYMHMWREAEEIFMDYYKQSAAKELKDEFKRAKSLNYKSPKIAKMLSLFIPGSGQIYAGKLKDGICSFLLNGLVGTFLVKSIKEKNWLDAVLFFSLFQRYYRGNLYHAKLHTEKYNEELNCKQALRLLYTIRRFSIKE